MLKRMTHLFVVVSIVVITALISTIQTCGYTRQMEEAHANSIP